MSTHLDTANNGNGAVRRDGSGRFAKGSRGGPGRPVGKENRTTVDLRALRDRISDCPEVKVVMTGNLGEDLAEWSEAGHLTTKAQRDAIKARMVDPDDPLKLVIV